MKAFYLLFGLVGMVCVTSYANEPSRKATSQSGLWVDARANQPEEIKDPLKTLNQKVYIFNDTLDRHLLRPVAIQYQQKVPEEMRLSYQNFRNNLREPWSGVNQLLQGKPKRALKTFGRFSLNTLTSLGFADVARRTHLPIEKDGLADTLGVWGVPSGAYVVLPMFGPSTLRDGTGLSADLLAQPENYLIKDDVTYWTNSVLAGVNLRAQYLGIDDVVSGNQYALMRDAYLQKRAFDIATKRGENAQDSLFSMGEDEFGDEDGFVDGDFTDEDEDGFTDEADVSDERPNDAQ